MVQSRLAARQGALLFAVTAATTSCTVDDLNLAGRSCPCVAGWICDPATNHCVPAGNGAGDGGAGGSRAQDAGADASPDGGCTTPAPWWHADYGHRQRIDVTAGTAAVPSRYSVAVPLDHATLVTASQSLASGDDVRVVCNGSESDRAVDPLARWNTSQTSIWFAVPTAIAAEQSHSDCYLYYDNPAALTPPNSWSDSMGADSASAVYLHGDDFQAHEDGEEPDGWTSSVSATFAVHAYGEQRWYGAGVDSGWYFPAWAAVMDNVRDAVWSAEFVHRQSGNHNRAALGARVDNGYAGVIVEVQDGQFSGCDENWNDLPTTSCDGVPNADIHFPLGSQGRIEIVTLADRISAYWHNPSNYTPERVILFEDLVFTAAAGKLGVYVERPDLVIGPQERTEADNVIVRHYVSPEPTVALGCQETAP